MPKFPVPVDTQHSPEIERVASYELPAEGFVRLPAILRVFPIGRSSWWAGVAAGIYPPAVKLGPRTTAWRVEDIRELLERAAN